MPSVNPLQADPSRQASASLAGYVFQVWLSLLQWMTLKDDEALQLEGNEDIDLLRAGGATTIQAKHLDPARSLTLRSPDVVEAIGNYLAARRRNPATRLRFRFLSTAVAGAEGGRPFGGARGLDLWQAARRKSDRTGDLDKAEQIRLFLLGSAKVTPGLLEWLGRATPETMLSDLIEPLEWDLGSGDTGSVRRAVEDELALLGEKAGLLASDSQSAAPGLLEIVVATASDKGGRILTRPDLLRHFEALTTITVPRSSLRAAIAGQALYLQAQAPGAGTASVGSVVVSPAYDELPDLPPICLPRTDVVLRAAASAAAGFVYLHGSTGMGKSTVANMVAKRTRSGSLWLDLGVAPEHAVAMMRSATASLSQSRTADGLVLDDLAFAGDRRWSLEGYGSSKMDPLGPSILARKAAITSARSGAWASACEFFLQAARLLPPDPDHNVFRAGLYADAGHAAARAADMRGAVDALCASLSLLKTMPNTPGQAPAFRLHKLFGNLVAWLANGEHVDADGFGTREQPPGACSDFELPGELATLQVTPIEIASVLLSVYAVPVISDFPLLLADLRAAAASPWTGVRALATGVQVSDAVVRGDVASVLPLAIRHAREAVEASVHARNGNPLGVQSPTRVSRVPEPGAVVFIYRPVLSCLLRKLEAAGSMAVHEGWRKVTAAL